MLLESNVKIHPNVFFIIVDAFERRSTEQHRVIGSLLGSNDNGVVEITNCFCVPHSELDEEVAIELDFAQDMYDIHQKVSPNETIVGWFSTGSDIINTSLLIHDYYKRVVDNPIHLTVDTTLQHGKLDFKCYCSVSIGLPNKTPATMFARIPVELTASEAEIVGVSASQRSTRSANKVAELQSDLNVIAEASGKIEEKLNVLLDYVNKVSNNEIRADPKVGREIMRLINCVPKMGHEQFQELLNTNIKDFLMVTYLSSLCKANVALNEKVTQYVGTNLAKDSTSTS